MSESGAAGKRDAKPAQAPKKPASDLRAVAAYLGKLRALLNKANAAHQAWIRELGLLMAEARDREPDAAEKAGKTGKEQLAIFRQLRAEQDQIQAPEVCENLHIAVRSWLDKQAASCEVLVEVGASGDLDKLRIAQGLLAEARADQRRFTADYAALVNAVRERAEALRQQVRERKKMGWPFARKKQGPKAG